MADSVAIVGTRTPDVTQSMAAHELALRLTRMRDIRVRTGAALGVDERAMKGALPEMLDVILPWKKYNRHLIPTGATIIVADKSNPEHKPWFESVDALHPASERLNDQARLLHARNYGIVHPTILVVAMPNRMGSGGTMQAIRIAKSLGIPVIRGNYGEVASPEVLINKVLTWIGKHQAA